ncbi:hypothetical protein ABBQ32_012076 [Trebouxia sp. C0010 RCD-2024]
MERSRKLRATSRPPSELTASVNAGNGAGSSEDEDYEATSLKKYRKLHDMEDLPPGASKEDMIPAVAKHFSQQVVDEKDTLVNFALSLKRHYLQTRQSPQQPLKKARNASKVKAR